MNSGGENFYAGNITCKSINVTGSSQPTSLNVFDLIASNSVQTNNVYTSNIFVGTSLTSNGTITTPVGFSGSQYSVSTIVGSLASPVSFSTASTSSPYLYNGSVSQSVTLSREGRATIYGITTGTTTTNILLVKCIYTSGGAFNNTNSLPKVSFTFIGDNNLYNINQAGVSYFHSDGSFITEWGFCSPNNTPVAISIGTSFIIDIECKLIVSA